jgi:hypothetical protein
MEIQAIIIRSIHKVEEALLINRDNKVSLLYILAYML